MESAPCGTTNPVRYFETIADQFALLAPDDPAPWSSEEFEIRPCPDLRDVCGRLSGRWSIAWATGDQAKLDALINGDLDQFPKARKLLLDDRNPALGDPDRRHAEGEAHLLYHGGRRPSDRTERRAGAAAQGGI